MRIKFRQRSLTAWLRYEQHWCCEMGLNTSKLTRERGENNQFKIGNCNDDAMKICKYELKKYPVIYSLVILLKSNVTLDIFKNIASNFGTVTQVSVAAQSGAPAPRARKLGSRIRNPLRAWMFVPVLSVLCCPV
jgi:hypothetical protein